MNNNDRPEALDGSTTASDAGGHWRDTKYYWALPAEHRLAVTRYELGLIAQHRLDEVCDIEMYRAVAESMNSRDHHDYMVALRKLERVRLALGEAEFTEATSEIRRIWNKRLAERTEVILECPNYDREPHDHSTCILLSDTIAALASSSPGLTKKQVMWAVERGLQIGMRKTSVQSMYSCGLRVINTDGDQEYLELDSMTLVFSAGVLRAVLPG